MRTLQASLVVAVWLLGIGANLVSPNASQAAPAPPDAIHPLDAIHEVMPGDDLHLIAGYYYGDARQWERIWRANRDQIANPNRLELGILLRIPDAVLPEESYADFVARARGGTGPAAVPVKSEVPAQPEVEAKPEVEVRIAGEEPAPATPVSPEREPATPAGPPAAAQPASPGTPGPSNVVGAPGTLPPRPILPGPASRP